MLDKLAKIISLSSVISSNNKIFNTSLPVLLQILSKTNDGYLLKLGTNKIEAKSLENITIGSKYWALLNENNNGLLISNLIKQPHIMDDIYKSPIIFNLDTLELNNYYFKDNVKLSSESLRDVIICTLDKCENRDEFILLSNMLFGLKQGVITLVIKDREKNFLIQIKKIKNKIEFCAAFSNLGLIYGELYDDSLILRVQFDKIKWLLKKYIYELPFNEVNIILDSRINLIFNMDNILDLEV